jgi:hypothetical protein
MRMQWRSEMTTEFPWLHLNVILMLAATEDGISWVAIDVFFTINFVYVCIYKCRDLGDVMPLCWSIQ